MTISEKVAYLKGLADGLAIDTEKSKEGKLIHEIIGILEEIGMSIEDLEEATVALGEEIDAVSDDLSDVEDVVFDEDEEDDDEDFFTVECPTCGKELVKKSSSSSSSRTSSPWSAPPAARSWWWTRTPWWRV